MSFTESKTTQLARAMSELQAITGPFVLQSVHVDIEFGQEPGSAGSIQRQMLQQILQVPLQEAAKAYLESNRESLLASVRKELLDRIVALKFEAGDEVRALLERELPPEKLKAEAWDPKSFDVGFEPVRGLLGIVDEMCSMKPDGFWMPIPGEWIGLHPANLEGMECYFRRAVNMMTEMEVPPQHEVKHLCNMLEMAWQLIVEQGRQNKMLVPTELSQQCEEFRKLYFAEFGAEKAIAARTAGVRS